MIHLNKQQIELLKAGVISCLPYPVFSQPYIVHRPSESLLYYQGQMFSGPPNSTLDHLAFIFLPKKFPFLNREKRLYFETGSVEPILTLDIDMIGVHRLHHVAEFEADGILAEAEGFKDWWESNWNLDGVRWDDDPFVWCVYIKHAKQNGDTGVGAREVEGVFTGQVSE